MSVIILSVICGLLAIPSVVYAYLYYSLKTKIKDNPNYQTQLIVSDMLAGNSIVRIERIAPEDFFLRRQ